MKTNTEIPVTQKLINALRKAAVELEEFQVDLALGKAEAADKYKEAKLQLRNTILDAKDWLKEEKEDLRLAIEELSNELSQGVADAKLELEQQKKRLKIIIGWAETLANENGSTIFSSERLGHELEKFKLKLELLPSQVALLKMGVEDELTELRKRIRDKYNEIEQKLSSGVKTGAAELREEMREAYRHLKEAFVRD